MSDSNKLGKAEEKVEYSTDLGELSNFTMPIPEPLNETQIFYKEEFVWPDKAVYNG